MLSVKVPLYYSEHESESDFFFDLLPLAHRCSINTHIGNNATDRKPRRFRSNINAPSVYTVSPLRAHSQQAKAGAKIFFGDYLLFLDLGFFLSFTFFSLVSTFAWRE